MDTPITPPSLHNTCPETLLLITPLPGNYSSVRNVLQVVANHVIRAGANFSAISGSDKNALIWDKAGYKRLMKLAATEGAEAAIRKTQSYEYWDEKPPEQKLTSLADYLEDVRASRDS